MRQLPSVSPLPSVARLVDETAVKSKAGALRIRGQASPSLYPRADTTSLADATTLRFGAVAGATQYLVEITDGKGLVVFHQETATTSVPVPAGVLKPGSRYGWTLRAFDRNDTVESAHSQISTLDLQTQSSRTALRTSLGPRPDFALLPLVAGIDQELGLLWEARQELQEAVGRSPENAGLRDALAHIDQDLPADSSR